jgi:hypothetical protein
MGKHALAAEGVDEGGPTYSQQDRISLEMFWHISIDVAKHRQVEIGKDLPVPEAPQTIKQN